MQRKIYFLIFLVLLLYIHNVLSATVEGTVYDISLNEAKNAKVEINTTPRQVFIARNASYKFNVPFGSYEVNATYKSKLEEASTKELIVIKDNKDNGNYVLDLILFPNSDEELLQDEIKIDKNPLAGKPNTLTLFLFIFVIFLIIALLIYFVIKSKNKTEADKKTDKNNLEQINLEQIIEIIKEEGGRTTQKDLRKKLPYSEAKISLMIAELENDGKIKKIKKGRGNIIILNH